MCDQQTCQGHVVDCASCKGKGRDPITPLIKACGVCNGVGKVLLTPAK